ncbi:helix-turn-helix domain-containing protein [Rhodobacterales bacterium HKCCE3408]|nr:helix-turn-helix domain-containing protein [Rhodobacterales bacterium HKCCE3408]
MRCLVYSSNALFGQCLARGLAGADGIEMAEACATAEAIPAAVARLGATSVLVDFGCSETAALVPRLARTLSDTIILGLSVDDRSTSNVVECARLGCHGIVPRDAGIEDVARIVADAEIGEVRIRPDVAAGMMRALAARTPEPTDPPDCLTRREREICTLVCEGLTNKEIAREVGRSVATVKNHVHSILVKLDLPRRGAIPSRMMGRAPAYSEPRRSA